jgi:hypothetical protein
MSEQPEHTSAATVEQQHRFCQSTDTAPGQRASHSEQSNRLCSRAGQRWLQHRKGKQTKETNANLESPLYYHRAHTVRAVPVLSHVLVPEGCVHYWLGAKQGPLYFLTGLCNKRREGKGVLQPLRERTSRATTQTTAGNRTVGIQRGQHSTEKPRATPRESKPAQPQCQEGIQTNHHSTTTVPRRGEERECHKVTSASQGASSSCTSMCRNQANTRPNRAESISSHENQANSCRSCKRRKEQRVCSVAGEQRKVNEGMSPCNQRTKGMEWKSVLQPPQPTGKCNELVQQ